MNALHARIVQMPTRFPHIAMPHFVHFPCSLCSYSWSNFISPDRDACSYSINSYPAFPDIKHVFDALATQLISKITFEFHCIWLVNFCSENGELTEITKFSSANVFPMNSRNFPTVKFSHCQIFPPYAHTHTKRLIS